MSSPKGKKRNASPPHEEVLADNPDIAVSEDASIACSIAQIRLHYFSISSGAFTI
jgi:hypothetical protein